MIRVYKALVLNDYPGKEYAEWVRLGKKKIETRMRRLFSYRGDIVICCGAGKSIGSPNAGKALCIVNIYDGRDMIKADEKHACIEWHNKRKSLLLKDWRYFDRDFFFSKQYESGTYQGIFEIRIPDDVKIIPQPQILPAYSSNIKPLLLEL